MNACVGGGQALCIFYLKNMKEKKNSFFAKKKGEPQGAEKRISKKGAGAEKWMD